MLLSNDASNNWNFLDEFGLQQQVTVTAHKSFGILYQVITSEKTELSEPLVIFITSSVHGVVHSDPLKNH